MPMPKISISNNGVLKITGLDWVLYLLLLKSGDLFPIRLPTGVVAINGQYGIHTDSDRYCMEAPSSTVRNKCN